MRLNSGSYFRGINLHPSPRKSSLGADVQDLVYLGGSFGLNIWVVDLGIWLDLIGRVLA